MTERGETEKERQNEGKRDRSGERETETKGEGNERQTDRQRQRESLTDGVRDTDVGTVIKGRSAMCPRTEEAVCMHSLFPFSTGRGMVQGMCSE